MVIEIGMGSVQVGECDVMGHMNVRHYVSRALEARAWLGLELGFVAGHPRLFAGFFDVSLIDGLEFFGHGVRTFLSTNQR